MPSSQLDVFNFSRLVGPRRLNRRSLAPAETTPLPNSCCRKLRGCHISASHFSNSFSRALGFVSYLLIKPPKSLTNKYLSDLTAKPFILKDLAIFRR